MPGLFHPLVALAPGLPADYGLLLALEPRLLELAALPTAARVPRLGALLSACVEALAACPLEPDQPWATLDARVAADRAGATPALPTVDDAAWAGSVVAVTAALEAAGAAGDEPDAPLIDAFVEGLAVLRAWAAAAAGLAAEPLPPLLTEAAVVTVAGERLDAMLARSLSNRLFGARLLVRGDLRAGLLRVALLERLTVAVARVHAAGAGRSVANADDLSAGHWIASLALARPALEQALLGVAEHAWTLASRPAGEPVP